MSPWMLFLIAVPLALGISISQSILSFVEDLEAAATATTTPNEDEDPSPTETVSDTGTTGGNGAGDISALGLLGLLTNPNAVAQSDMAENVGKPADLLGHADQTSLIGGQAADLMLSETIAHEVIVAETAVPEAAAETVMVETHTQDGTVECEPENPVDFIPGQDQLIFYLAEDQQGDAHSLLPQLMLEYDSTTAMTTLSSDAQTLITLNGDHTAASLAFYDAPVEGTAQWLDADGRPLPGADARAADLILVAGHMQPAAASTTAWAFCT